MELEVFTERPEPGCCTPMEDLTYRLLESCEVPFRRVQHPAAATMQDLAPAERALGSPMCKNLLLSNRQKTKYYFLALPGDKPFVTKDFSAALGIARVSFASAGEMQNLLGLTPGSLSVVGLINDREGRVQLCIDREIEAEPFFLFHPGINTASVAISGEDLFQKLLPALGHEATAVDLPDRSEQQQDT